ncbi:hypothetical protein OOZ15_10075 [Galbibacter sp. EGI 63066]|uniref:hypothetical protein n=1 Tax=Galbibacter sp. EGI 63066 TaxID=2993559 RepID=UPI0022490936|nr:hypothetical protein [Galbibacter sp. EGI 63066]MCX2680286.1 hypothetical protein [Galbibacter sp. EGI 63066]
MKFFSFLCIVLGAVFVFMFNDQSEYDKYMKILGFVLLMFGLYRSTKLWVKDNPKNEKKDESDELDDESKK